MSERERAKGADGLGGASPTCFVLMPFGVKPDPAGGTIDFDHVYDAAIRPGIEAAGMNALRADAEMIGGIIHKPMFERLLLCDFAVADLTTGNPNVFYELGVRHTARPGTTLAVSADVSRLPFDVSYLRTQTYRLGEDRRLDEAAAREAVQAIAGWLRTAREGVREGEDGEVDLPGTLVDSPLFQLVEGYRPPPLAHLKTDDYAASTARRGRIGEEIAAVRALAGGGATARAEAVERLDAIRARLADTSEGDRASVLFSLVLAYRAFSAWGRMCDVIEAMPEALRRPAAVREQWAMALNRRAEAGEDDAPALQDRALRLLEEVEAGGANPETSGLIGRIHKSRWRAAKASGAPAAGHLRRAVDAYRCGFEADWRDFYPGINLVTLLHAQGAADALARTLPVVRYAVERRLHQEPEDYWKHATLLELAVLADDRDAAEEHLADAHAAILEDFQPRTTADNLAIIAETVEEPGWIEGLVAQLLAGWD